MRAALGHKKCADLVLSQAAHALGSFPIEIYGFFALCLLLDELLFEHVGQQRIQEFLGSVTPTRLREKGWLAVRPWTTDSSSFRVIGPFF